MWPQYGLLIGMVALCYWIIDRGSTSLLELRRKHDRIRQLAADADEQHAALLRGDMVTGIYGRYSQDITEQENDHGVWRQGQEWRRWPQGRRRPQGRRQRRQEVRVFL